jgi:hypothetical protein
MSNGRLHADSDRSADDERPFYFIQLPTAWQPVFAVEPECDVQTKFVLLSR